MKNKLIRILKYSSVVASVVPIVSIASSNNNHTLNGAQRYYVKINGKSYTSANYKDLEKLVLKDVIPKIKSGLYVGKKHIKNTFNEIEFNPELIQKYDYSKFIPAYKDIHGNFVDNKQSVIDSYIPNYAIEKKYYDGTLEFDTYEEAMESIANTANNSFVPNIFYEYEDETGQKYHYNVFLKNDTDELIKKLIIRGDDDKQFDKKMVSYINNKYYTYTNSNKNDKKILNNFINFFIDFYDFDRFNVKLSFTNEDLDPNNDQDAINRFKPIFKDNFVDINNKKSWNLSSDKRNLEKIVNKAWIDKYLFNVDKKKFTKYSLSEWLNKISKGAIYDIFEQKTESKKFWYGVRRRIQGMSLKRNAKFLDFKTFETWMEHDEYNQYAHGWWWQRYPARFLINSKTDNTLGLKIKISDTFNKIKLKNEINLFINKLQKDEIDISTFIDAFAKSKNYVLNKINLLKNKEILLDFLKNKVILSLNNLDDKTIENNEKMILLKDEKLKIFKQENNKWVEQLKNEEELNYWKDFSFETIMINEFFLVEKNTNKDPILYSKNNQIVIDPYDKNRDFYNNLLISENTNSIIQEIKKVVEIQNELEDLNRKSKTYEYRKNLEFPILNFNGLRVVKKYSKILKNANESIFNISYNNRFYTEEEKEKYIQNVKNGLIKPRMGYTIEGLKSILEANNMKLPINMLEFNHPKLLKYNSELILGKLIAPYNKKIFYNLGNNKKILLDYNIFNLWSFNLEGTSNYFEDENDLINFMKNYINNNKKIVLIKE